MNDKPKTKLRGRLLRWGVVGLAALSTLAAFLVTEENWRGKRAWENYRREAEARGERFDLASVVPSPVPDSQNFCCAPIVADVLGWNRDRSPEGLWQGDKDAASRTNFTIFRGASENWPTNTGNWPKGKMIDLKEWQAYFRNFAGTSEGKTNGFPVASESQTPAADVLLALSCFDPAIKELRAALLRPYAQLPLKYEEGFDAAGELLPYLANVKKCGHFFQLRALAELAAAQGGLALDDVKLLLGVTDSLRDQPYLISHLVRIAMLAITLQPVYEGLAQQRWTDGQLAELEQALAKLDFLADYRRAMQGEKIMAIQAIEKQRLTREYKIVDDSSGTNKIVTVSLRWVPSAYFYQNELAFAQMHQLYISRLIDQSHRIIDPAALRQTEAEVLSRLNPGFAPYKTQALMVLPAIAQGVKKFALIQAQVELARVACALERFRLANGNYPETLAELAPQLIEKLPHDIINGQPLHYRRLNAGQFILYSVGWNEKDDGGQIGLTKSGRFDREKGDWVWQYPSK